MTFIGFTTSKTDAQIVSDTWTYRNAAQELGGTTKVTTILHLDAAIAAQGESVFTEAWKFDASVLAQGIATFDDLNAVAQAAMRNTWAESRRHLQGHPSIPTMVFHVGYSEAAQRFTATGFDSETDFEPTQFNETFVHPSPLDIRPSGFELERYAEAAEQNLARFADHPNALAAYATAQDNLRHLRGLAPLASPPETLDQWRLLAEKSRAHRSIAARAGSGYKILVGGKLHHTYLTRGCATQQAFYQFDDSNENLAEIMQGTLHPLGQAGPCPCGSELSYRGCCMLPLLDEPCICGQGALLRDCCAAASAPLELAAV